LTTVRGGYGQRVERASEVLPALRQGPEGRSGGGAAGGIEYDLQAPGKWVDTVYGK